MEIHIMARSSVFFNIALSLFFWFSISSVKAKEYNILNYGAKANGQGLDTEFIQKAIDDAAKEGGIVLFPAGKYLTGTLYLKSNITLRIEKGATILGSTSLDDYPENAPAFTFFRKGILKRALIYADQLENITIEGEGTIDGQGFAFKEPVDKKVSSYSVRPYVIWMIRCKNVRVKGIRLQNSALWMQHYLGCEKLYIHNIDVYNHSNKNNDMMDIDGCKDVIISDCIGDTDDDGITLKSTHSLPNENITINNCILSSHCNAIKCGTESNAGFKNITISNCIIRPSQDREKIYGKPDGISGISLEVVDGAVMDGVQISNIVMDGPAVPIFIRLGNRARGYDPSLPTPEVGSIRNVSISNVTAYHAGQYGSSITGIPGHLVENISLENIRIYYSGGGTMDDAEQIVEEKIKSYPEATMFEKLPSYSLYIRHAKNINLSNITCHFDSAEQRPPFSLEDVSGIRILNMSADVSPSSTLIKVKDVEDLFISDPWISQTCKSVIQINGSNLKSIKLSGIDKRKFINFYTATEKVPEKEIMITNAFE